MYDGWRARTVRANRIDIGLVEVGEGPLVLFVHGFPELWYSWRHQLDAIAAAGYRAVAIDVRGYGVSSAPPAIEDYRMTQHVADNLGVVEALGEDRAVIVGHDWGAPIAWNSALIRPDVFIGVAGLSVPYSAPGPTRPSDAFRAMGGEREFYIEYFQQPGRAEAEIEADIRSWLLGFYYSISGDAPAAVAAEVARIPHGAPMRAGFAHPPEGAWPTWMSPADLEVYTAAFETSGLRGPLNRYRNVDRDWEDLAVFANRPIEVPALFIGGDRDGPTLWGAPAIERFSTTLPALHRCLILDDCGHWTQQERPDAVNGALIDFLDAVHGRHRVVGDAS